MKKSFFCKKNDEAQLLLIGGVLITFLILAMSSISISISNINKPIHKTDFIRSDYANVREEFGRALHDTLEDKLVYITTPGDLNTICMPHFNYTKQMFIFATKYDGYYFNVDYVSAVYDGVSGLTSLTVDLSFSNEKESISGRVTYDFT